MEEPRTLPRVVVTGLGVVTSVGQNPAGFWSSLVAGRSGISRLTRFDASAFSCQVAAQVEGFDGAKWMDPKEARRFDLYIQYAIAASVMAFEDAGLKAGDVDPAEMGVLIGSGVGGIDTMERAVHQLGSGGPRKVSPFMIPSMLANMASGMTAMRLNAQGPNYAVVSACSSSTHTLGEALRMLKLGDAQVMLAGGSEAAITPVSCAGFCSMKAMSTSFNDRPEKASRPFDKDRDGFVMGEGAGILVLETLDRARARGARIYAELAGSAATCDAYHITSPDPEGKGLASCIRRALKSAGVAPEEVGYINAHGTSTEYNDKFETAAIKQVFGEHAYRLKVSSTKSMTGHLLGAAGAIEAAVCAKVLQTGDIPPTINYETPDPDCDLDYTPNVAGRTDTKVALSLNLGFGGHNAALVFRKFEG